MASGILNFSKGDSTFTCSTQLMPYQRVHISGTTGRIEIEIPFNAPPLIATRIWLHTKTALKKYCLKQLINILYKGMLFQKLY